MLKFPSPTITMRHTIDMTRVPLLMPGWQVYASPLIKTRLIVPHFIGVTVRLVRYVSVSVTPEYPGVN